MTLQTIVLNNTNADSGNPNNNVYKYNFPSNVSFKKSQISVSNVFMYYSWYNISSKQGNNTFSYIWYSGSTPTATTVSITIPDSFMDISSLNEYLQSIMISNGHYLTDSSNSNLYYIEFVTNATYYAVQLNCYQLPTAAEAAAAGYTAPSSWAGYVTTHITPQVIIPSSNSIKDIIGFTSGTYPSSTQTTTYSVVSSYTPEVTFVQSIVMLCNLVNNPIANPPNVLYSFAPGGVSFGSTISVSPSTHNYVSIADGNYNSLIITFVDQNFNPLIIKDTSLIIQISIFIEDE